MPKSKAYEGMGSESRRARYYREAVLCRAYIKLRMPWIFEKIQQRVKLEHLRKGNG